MTQVLATTDSFEKFRGEDAEMCAIGCMMLSGKACDEVLHVAQAKCFYRPSHQTIFEVCQQIRKESGREPDLISLKERLFEKGQLKNVGGTDYLIQLMEHVPSASNAKVYAQIVADFWRRREIKRRAVELAKKAQDGEGLKDLYKLISEIGQGLSDETSDTFKLSEIDLADDRTNQGITTGFVGIDSISNVGGWPVGEPSMIMGATGRGKTCLAAQCLLAAADAGKKVAFATYEMNRYKIKRRMLKQISGHWEHPGDLVAGMDYKEALVKLNDPFYDVTIFDPSGRDSLDNTVEDLVNWTMVQKQGNGLDILFIDYSQLLRSSKGSSKKFEDMEAVADRLKKLAMRANIALVFLSQQTDEGHAKGTKAFEDISSLWLRISPDQEAILIPKNRYGAAPISIMVEFDKRRLVYVEK